MLNEHTQLSDVEGLAGQNESNPRANFGSPSGHVFTRYVVNNEVRWLDPSYGVEYVGSTDLERILKFENTAVYGTGRPGFADLEILMDKDLDGDGEITNADGQTYGFEHHVVNRQNPGTQDVDFDFLDSM